MDDNELIAQELSDLAVKIGAVEDRLAEVENVNARLEEAALTTARAMAEISRHWDAVYDAMRREEVPKPDASSERDNAAARKRRSGWLGRSLARFLARFSCRLLASRVIPRPRGTA